MHTVSPDKQRSRVLETQIAHLGSGTWTILTSCGHCQRDRIEIPLAHLPHRSDATIAHVINRLVCQMCGRPPGFVRLDGPGKFSMILRGPLLR